MVKLVFFCPVRSTNPLLKDFPDGSMAWNYPMLVPLRFGEWHRVAQLEVAPPGPYNASWTYGGAAGGIGKMCAVWGQDMLFMGLFMYSFGWGMNTWCLSWFDLFFCHSFVVIDWWHSWLFDCLFGCTVSTLLINGEIPAGLSSIQPETGMMQYNVHPCSSNWRCGTQKAPKLIPSCFVMESCGGSTFFQSKRSFSNTGPNQRWHRSLSVSLRTQHCCVSSGSERGSSSASYADAEFDAGSGNRWAVYQCALGRTGGRNLQEIWSNALNQRKTGYIKLNFTLNESYKISVCFINQSPSASFSWHG